MDVGPGEGTPKAVRVKPRSIEHVPQRILTSRICDSQPFHPASWPYERTDRRPTQPGVISIRPTGLFQN
jgi:hypothetical protein